MGQRWQLELALRSVPFVVLLGRRAVRSASGARYWEPWAILFVDQRRPLAQSIRLIAIRRKNSGLMLPKEARRIR